jgi:hypothetical protein
MIQSEMDPCIFCRIMEDEKGIVTAYLIVISWVDDCRYFGTDELVSEYESNVVKHCKCTLEGDAKEFVSMHTWAVYCYSSTAVQLAVQLFCCLCTLL